MAPDRTKPGVTYICQQNPRRKDPAKETSEIAGTEVILVCHYNDMDMDKHISDVNSKFDYFGYVFDLSNLTPEENKEAMPSQVDDDNFHKMEGRYYECLLKPKTDQGLMNPYTMFVRFMISPEAKDLWDEPAHSPLGVGFPVGWAVRGYMPEELERRNQGREQDKKLRNKMNMLPVFRGDFKDLKDVVGPDKPALRRFYYILNDPSAQLLRPKSLIEQVRDAKRTAFLSRDNPADITGEKGAEWEAVPSDTAVAAEKAAKDEVAKERAARADLAKKVAEAEAARTQALTDALAPLKDANAPGTKALTDAVGFLKQIADSRLIKGEPVAAGGATPSSSNLQ